MATDNNKRKRKTARHLALKLCLAVVRDGQSLSDLIPTVNEELDSDADRRFCSELTFGVCRYFYLFNSQITGYVKKPLKNKDLDIQLILMLGFYQLRFLRVEDHAAVNETVKLAIQIRKNWARSLVNAVLRSYLRDLGRQRGNEGRKPVDDLDELEHRASYPDWLIQRIESDWPDNSASVFAAGNHRPPMTLRVDLQRHSRQDYLKQLAPPAVEHSLVNTAIVLDKPVPVDLLAGFDQARVSVQDASAQLAASLLEVKQGMRVLDACAAPGGKTLHLLQSEPAQRLLALDSDPQRLERVEQNLERGGLNAELECTAAENTGQWFDGEQFDRILLDVPCSASGIVSRHPDIRLLRRKQDIQALVAQQQVLLEAIWPLLKEGGRLVYSTCSIFKDENERQIMRFMESHQNCVEKPIKQVQWGVQRPIGRQILPNYLVNGKAMDGFYYACLDKQS